MAKGEEEAISYAKWSLAVMIVLSDYGSRCSRSEQKVSFSSVSATVTSIL